MEDSGFVKMKRLRDEDLMSSRERAGAIEKYCFLLEGDELMIKDISYKDGIRIGKQYGQLYTLANPEHLPSLCGPRINFDKYSTDKTKFSVGFASALGQLLPCNHIYNQYLFIEDFHKTLKLFESKRLRLQSLWLIPRKVITKEATNDFLNEAIGEGRMPIKAHFNVLSGRTTKTN